MMAADHSSDACEAVPSPAIAPAPRSRVPRRRSLRARRHRPSLVDDLAVIDRVLEQVEQATLAERNTAPMRSARPLLDLGPDSFSLQLGDQLIGGARSNIAPHDCPDPLSFFGNGDEFAVDHLITQGNRSAHPQALLLRGDDLVPDPLAGHLALKLGEG